jgi:hypothetical protein
LVVGFAESPARDSRSFLPPPEITKIFEYQHY